MAQDAGEESGARAAVEEVAAFLGAHPPFSTLAAADLERVAGASEVEFFAAGETIFAEDGRTVEHLRVIRAGVVEIALAGRVLDLLGPGELVGQASMLSGLPPGFSARAEEDVLCYRIPEPVARDVLARPETVQFVARSLLDMHARAPLLLAGAGAVPDPANRAVRMLLRGVPVICAPDEALRDVAARMTAAGASAAVVRLESSLGIITDRDLRARVVADGLSYDAPAERAMSAPAYTVAADALGGDVLLEMLDRGVRHFPVLSPAGEVLGVIEAADIQAAEMVSSFNLRTEIGRADTFAALRQASQGLRPAVVALHDTGLAAQSIAWMYSALLDALTRRAIELALAAAGPAPGEFAWFALGSQARREAVPASDLDSALAWYGSSDEAELRVYLERLGRTVSDELAKCGLQVDSHGATASDALFVRSVESWRRLALSWIERPTQEKALILTSLLVDSRPVWGVHLGAALSDAFRSARERTRLMRLLARLALAHRPPTGFMRGIVVEHNGEHRGLLDIKRGGLLPVADLARWAAMNAGITSASTGERLRAARDAGALSAQDARTLEDAYELFTDLRLEHQVGQLRAGREPDDFVDLGRHSPLTRRHLKDAFRAVASVQRGIASELNFAVR
ncbi:MAG TPA: putative nucleotidyltransferase substrate binding domain-containing protein [Solirubrobacteraceae bacterium]|nr:putative nucleotidyltransferase substrate binding domain-containing protein [Solirubrobacteraceae bacterium]